MEIIVWGNLVEDVAAEFDKGEELDLERIGGAQKGGMESLGKLSDDSRIKGVGLGEAVLARRSLALAKSRTWRALMRAMGRR